MAYRSVLIGGLCLALGAVVPRVAQAVCGDSILDPGEECDQVVCCSDTCAFDPAGAPCVDYNPCVHSACDGAGTCGQAEACQPAAVSNVTVKNGDGLEENRVTWKWKSIGVVPPGAFGNPTATTGITACFLDADRNGSGYTVIAGDLCGGSPCWRAAGDSFIYKSAGHPFPPDGVRKMALRPGDPDGRIKFTMRGWFVTDLPLTAPVTMRLLRDDSTACWEATFPVLSVNTAELVRARLP